MNIVKKIRASKELNKKQVGLYIFALEIVMECLPRGLFIPSYDSSKDLKKFDLCERTIHCQKNINVFVFGYMYIVY